MPNTSPTTPAARPATRAEAKLIRRAEMLLVRVAAFSDEAYRCEARAAGGSERHRARCLKYSDLHRVVLAELA